MRLNLLEFLSEMLSVFHLGYNKNAIWQMRSHLRQHYIVINKFRKQILRAFSKKYHPDNVWLKV